MATYIGTSLLPVWAGATTATLRSGVLLAITGSLADGRLDSLSTSIGAGLRITYSSMAANSNWASANSIGGLSSFRVSIFLVPAFIIIFISFSGVVLAFLRIQ